MYSINTNNSTNDPLAFVGSSWSLWPPHNARGGMNLVRGVEKINSDIITILLIFRGELTTHYDLGVAVPLFAPTSDPRVKAFAYQAAEAIADAQKEIEDLTVDVVENPDFTNQLTVVVQYRPISSANYNTLTFGYYEYLSATDLESFGVLNSTITTG